MKTRRDDGPEDATGGRPNRQVAGLGAGYPVISHFDLSHYALMYGPARRCDWKALTSRVGDGRLACRPVGRPADYLVTIMLMNARSADRRRRTFADTGVPCRQTAPHIQLTEDRVVPV